jgi:RNA polymerase sigma-70 factor (ECF subfamily)
VRRRFIDLTRRQKARPQASGEVPEMPSSETDDEVSTQLAEALSRLTPTYRELLVLAYIEGLDNRELGQVLGLPPRRASKRLSRARVALRNILLKGGEQALEAGEAEVSTEQGG